MKNKERAVANKFFINLCVSINCINESLEAIIDIILYGSTGVKTEKLYVLQQPLV
ncbi:hypothetical protein L323_07725 [Ruminiclostridium papyrosolvens C7]|uniref:Uncharacterized protein n=1 Tax=Ruminiclostridium papyrosolvens C7 TaxID=1330534 RepID=U4R2M9_9FIRM|nr:hypothetical protein L323_07725 [Ruminiclostridium papyrosolvens C7]